MKKISSFLVLAIMSLISLAANAADITVTLNLDDASHYTVTVNNVEQAIVTGENKLTLSSSWDYVSINANDGWLIKGITNESGEEETLYSRSYFSFYTSSSLDGAVYNITSQSEKLYRKASCTVNVDNASGVKVIRSGTGSTVSLTDGANTVMFNAEDESTFTITSTDYNKDLYEVKLNGDKQTADDYGRFQVDVTEGCTIDITANYPDVDVPVHFTYTGEESKEFVAKVEVSGNEVTNYNDDNFTVKAGDAIEIFAADGYTLDAITVNGEDDMYGYYKGSYYLSNITTETTFCITAHKLGVVNATVTVDNPDNVVVRKGSYSGDILTLETGDNAITISEDLATLNIAPVEGANIVSVSDGTTDYEADYYGEYNVKLTEGMHLTITTATIVRDKKATVNVTGKSLADYAFTFKNSSKEKISLVEGANEIDFCDSDNTFEFHAESYDANQISIKVTLNGNEVECSEPNNYGGYWDITLSDGDTLDLVITSLTDDINSVNGNSSDNSNIFDIQGRKVTRMSKGLYIINGKKVVRK